MDVAASVDYSPEGKAKGSGFSYFARLLKPYRAALAWGLAAVLMDAILTLLRPWPLKIVIDRVLPRIPKPSRLPGLGRWLDALPLDRTQLLVAACLATLVLALGTGFFTYLYKRIIGGIGRVFAFDLRRALFDHLQRLSLRFHDSQQTGDLVTRVTSDVATVQEVIADTGIDLVKNIFQFATMLGIMLWLNWKFTLVSTWVAPFLFWVLYRVRKRVKKAARQARTSNGLMASVAAETLSSIRIVQGLSQEDQQIERFQTHNRRSLEAYQQGILYQARLAPGVDLLEAAGLAFMMGFGAIQVMNGASTVGDVVIFFAYLNKLYGPLKSLSKVTLVLNKAGVASERLVSILEVEPEVVDAPDASAIGPRSGAIEFRNVTFEYEESRPALSKVSLSIRPGERIALVGPSGAGKSTLLSLIARLYDPCEGEVRLAGRDVRDYRLRSLREQIGLVLQDTLLFSGTIRENVAFGRPDATESEVVAACVTADADEFIRRLPKGYDTPIAERGATLSGGQRQRLAIARAILRNAPILLLDEPTTGLDAISEELVIKALERAARGRTTLLVSHRAACTRFADRVIVIERGKIVDSGTPEELLTKEGFYAMLQRPRRIAG